MSATLILGTGNLDRSDDGAAYHVLNTLRRRLGRPPLCEDGSRPQPCRADVDALFVRQLVPELMETAAGYRRLIFVDAHVGDDRADLACEAVAPAYAPSPFTHHLSPAAFLALTGALHGRRPDGIVVSIRGRDFGFARSLSPGTQRLVPPAVDRILTIVGGGGGTEGTPPG